MSTTSGTKDERQTVLMVRPRAIRQEPISPELRAKAIAACEKILDEVKEPRARVAAAQTLFALHGRAIQTETDDTKLALEERRVLVAEGHLEVERDKNRRETQAEAIIREIEAMTGRRFLDPVAGPAAAPGEPSRPDAAVPPADGKPVLRMTGKPLPDGFDFTKNQ